MVVVENLDIANGILLLVFSIISLIVGFKIMAKYFKFKRKEFLFLGLAWIALASPWYPGTISFILVFILGTEKLYTELYFLIGNVLIPPCFVLWLVVFTDLLLKKKQKLIVILFAIVNALYLVVFLYFLFTNPIVIGELKGDTDVQYYNFVMIYDVCLILITFLTGIIFARQTLKSDLQEIRLKGRLLYVAFTSFFIGATLNTILPLNIVTLVIFRTFEILSAITFYGGFTLPEWMKKLFLKNKNSNLKKTQ